MLLGENALFMTCEHEFIVVRKSVYVHKMLKGNSISASILKFSLRVKSTYKSADELHEDKNHLF